MTLTLPQPRAVLDLLSMFMGGRPPLAPSRGMDLTMPPYGTHVCWLQADPSGEAMEELANRISTNHTFFWRENSHFNHFAETALPEIVARRRQQGGGLRFCAPVAPPVKSPTP